jgi:hypothetical protein
MIGDAHHCADGSGTEMATRGASHARALGVARGALEALAVLLP